MYKRQLFSLADTEGKLYLYRNNYSLPLGFMISSDMVSSSDMATITAHHNALTGAAYDSLQPQSSDDSLEELFSSADDVEENIDVYKRQPLPHTAPDTVWGVLPDTDTSLQSLQPVNYPRFSVRTRL